jgi:O-antigen/teichoic acid export membrane protein
MLAQLFGVCASPLLSRLYSPEDFGVVGTIMAFVSCISVVGSLKYELAIVIEKDGAKSDLVKRLSLYVLLATTGICVIGLLLLLVFNPVWLQTASYKDYLVWCIPLVFFTGFFNVYNSSLNRGRLYKNIAKAAVCRRLGVIITQIILGFSGAQALGLVVGNLAGVLIAAAIVFVTSASTSKNISEVPDTLIDVGKKYYRMPLYAAPQNFFNAFSQNLPVYILGYYYGVEVVGAYWFTVRLMQIPLMLVGQSVRQVFFREAIELKSDRVRLCKLYNKAIGLLFAIAIFPALLVALFGQDLFALCFGSQWLMAGEFSEWVVLWLAVAFVNPPAVSLFNVYDMQKHFAIYDLSLMFSRVSVLILGGATMGAIDTVTVYSLVGAVFNLYLILLWFMKMNKQPNDVTI